MEVAAKPKPLAYNELEQVADAILSAKARHPWGQIMGGDVQRALEDIGFVIVRKKDLR